MNPQFCSRSCWSGYPPLGFAQGRFNDLFLLCSEPSRKFNLAPRLRCRVGRESQLSSTEKPSVSHTTTERSITFCNSRMFPGQGYACSKLEALLVRSPVCSFPLFSHNDRRSTRPGGECLLFVPQRRNLDWKNVEPVKQVAPKHAGSDGSLQVAVRGSNDPNIGSDGSSSTDTLKFVFLQHTQSAICVSAGSSPTSSRKIVPPSASSNRPKRR